MSNSKSTSHYNYGTEVERAPSPNIVQDVWRRSGHLNAAVGRVVHVVGMPGVSTKSTASTAEQIAPRQSEEVNLQIADLQRQIEKLALKGEQHVA